MNEVRILEAELHRVEHQSAIVRLVDSYAPSGLSEDVRRHLIPGLIAHPAKLILLAEREGEIAGIAVCFLSFSTFAARPLLNIHDLVVDPRHRRQGVARRLLEGVEARSRELGCCKITLEVVADNVARRLYQQMGFEGLQESATATLFAVKKLP